LIGALAIAAAASGPAAAVPMVGNAQTVVRDVAGVLDKIEQTIYVDSDVFQDEDIVTGPKSATRIIFKDGTNLEMGENSRLKLTKLVFDPDPSKSKVVIKAAAGVFRWTSGNLPHEAYGISTPVATIGIRGTTLEFIIAPSGLTTVALSRGSIIVANKKGDSVILKPGEATTILPPDADGDQAPPSAPGPLSAELQQMLWTMTVMIRSADPPSDVNPSAGGTATTPASFNPNAGDNGGTNSGTNTGPNFGTPNFSPPNVNSPFVFPQNQQNQPTTQDNSSGSSGPTCATPPCSTTPPPGGSTPPPGGGTTPPGNSSNSCSLSAGHIQLGSVTLPATPAGGTRTVTIILVIPDGCTVNLADLQILDDPSHAFKLEFVADQTPTAATDANGDPAEAFSVLAIFSPPPGSSGPFTAILELPDGDPTIFFDLTLNGDVAAIAEPASAALFGVGLLGFVWKRRRAFRS
jgi:hypothetical protein